MHRKRGPQTQMMTAAKRRRYTNKYNTPANYRSAFGLRPTYHGFTPRAFAHGEWKYKDTAATYAVDNATNVALLNGLVPGTSATTRVGQRVTFRTIELRAYNYVTPVTGEDQLQRMMLVLDRQPNGVALTALQVLQTANVVAPRNLENRKRFKTLWDKSFSLNASAEPGSRRTVKAYIKFRRPIITDYNVGVAGTIADISTNSLYLINIGTNPAGVTAGGSNSYIRMRYEDI